MLKRESVLPWVLCSNIMPHAVCFVTAGARRLQVAWRRFKSRRFERRKQRRRHWWATTEETSNTVAFWRSCQRWVASFFFPQLFSHCVSLLLERYCFWRRFFLAQLMLSLHMWTSEMVASCDHYWFLFSTKGNKIHEREWATAQEIPCCRKRKQR